MANPIFLILGGPLGSLMECAYQEEEAEPVVEEDCGLPECRVRVNED